MRLRRVMKIPVTNPIQGLRIGIICHICQTTVITAAHPLTTAAIPSHGKTAAMNMDIGSVHVAEPSTKIGTASMTTDFTPF